MYTTLQPFNDETVKKLQTLFHEVKFTDKNKRLGGNGPSNISVYMYSKWKTWNRNQTSEFKSMFSINDIEKSIIGWFLHIPANSGFLDLMTTWSGSYSGTIIAYALEDSQKIWLNNKEITVNKGEGIKFNLSVNHEIKKSAIDQKWACIMQL